jgi:magnesium-transporting ATPase (P-type)
MMQIFFIVLLENIITSTVDSTPGIHNSHNKSSDTASCYHKLKNEEYQVFYINDEFSEINIESTDKICDFDDTSSTTKLISINKITNEDKTNPTCLDLLKIFSFRFIVCCSVLLALFAYASYCIFNINHKAWGFLVAISFLLVVLIFCAIINGLEKLKEINKF